VQAKPALADNPQCWKRGRVVDCTGLENRRPARVREFESHRFRQITRGSAHPLTALRLSGALAAALFIALAWYLAPLDPGVLALQLSFTPRAFARVVHAWPPEGLARYRAHIPFDFVLLAAYGSFGALLATRTAVFARCRPALRRFAPWALPLAALFDGVENALHLWLTEAPRFGMPMAYAVAGTASTLKWLLLLGFAASLADALRRHAEG
jgi:hypothetical protein